MANKILSLIEKSGLKLVKDYKIQDIQMFETDYEIKNQCIGKYFIVPTTSELFMSIADEQSYPKFETDLLEGIYFQIQGDLRWNLYLVFLLNDDDWIKVPEETRGRIERGKHYARKMVISEPQFLRSVPVARLTDPIIKEKFKEPYDEWLSLLEPNNLSFCLEKYSSEKLNLYLKGEILTAQGKENDVQPRDEIDNTLYTPTIIDRVVMDGFRDHCFSPNTELNF